MFLGDPSQATGWREYSARGYYGSISELAHFATLYDSRPERFEAGLNRLREFSVDPLLVDRNAVEKFRGKYGISVLGAEIRRNFYEAPTQQIRLLASRYGVDYVIYEKSKLISTQASIFRTAFENESYIVFEIN